MGPLILCMNKITRTPSYGRYPLGTRAGSGCLSSHSNLDHSSCNARLFRTKNRPVRKGFSVYLCSCRGMNRATHETVPITSAMPATDRQHIMLSVQLTSTDDDEPAQGTRVHHVGLLAYLR